MAVLAHSLGVPVKQAHRFVAHANEVGKLHDTDRTGAATEPEDVAARLHTKLCYMSLSLKRSQVSLSLRRGCRLCTTEIAESHRTLHTTGAKELAEVHGEGQRCATTKIY